MDLLDIRLYKRVKFSRILFNLITLQGLIMKLYGAQIILFVNYESNIVRIALDTGMMKRSDII